MKKKYKILGNGDEQKGKRLVKLIAKRVKYARKKHQFFAEGKYNALFPIFSEVEEFIHAVKKESLNRAESEGLDVITTLIRFLNKEYEKNVDK